MSIDSSSDQLINKYSIGNNSLNDKAIMKQNPSQYQQKQCSIIQVSNHLDLIIVQQQSQHLKIREKLLYRQKIKQLFSKKNFQIYYIYQIDYQKKTIWGQLKQKLKNHKIIIKQGIVKVLIKQVARRIQKQDNQLRDLRQIKEIELENKFEILQIIPQNFKRKCSQIDQNKDFSLIVQIVSSWVERIQKKHSKRENSQNLQEVFKEAQRRQEIAFDKKAIIFNLQRIEENPSSLQLVSQSQQLDYKQVQIQKIFRYLRIFLHFNRLTMQGIVKFSNRIDSYIALQIENKIIDSQFLKFCQLTNIHNYIDQGFRIQRQIILNCSIRLTNLQSIFTFCNYVFLRYQMHQSVIIQFTLSQMDSNLAAIIREQHNYKQSKFEKQEITDHFKRNLRLSNIFEGSQGNDINAFQKLITMKIQKLSKIRIYNCMHFLIFASEISPFQNIKAYLQVEYLNKSNLFQPLLTIYYLYQEDNAQWQKCKQRLLKIKIKVKQINQIVDSNMMPFKNWITYKKSIQLVLQSYKFPQTFENFFNSKQKNSQISNLFKQYHHVYSEQSVQKLGKNQKHSLNQQKKKTSKIKINLYKFVQHAFLQRQQKNAAQQIKLFDKVEIKKILEYIIQFAFYKNAEIKAELEVDQHEKILIYIQLTFADAAFAQQFLRFCQLFGLKRFIFTQHYNNRSERIEGQIQINQLKYITYYLNKRILQFRADANIHTYYKFKRSTQRKPQNDILIFLENNLREQTNYSILKDKQQYRLRLLLQLDKIHEQMIQNQQQYEKIKQLIEVIVVGILTTRNQINQEKNHQQILSILADSYFGRQFEEINNKFLVILNSKIKQLDYKKTKLKKTIIKQEERCYYDRNFFQKIKTSKQKRQQLCLQIPFRYMEGLAKNSQYAVKQQLFQLVDLQADIINSRDIIEKMFIQNPQRQQKYKLFRQNFPQKDLFFMMKNEKNLISLVHSPRQFWHPIARIFRQQSKAKKYQSNLKQIIKDHQQNKQYGIILFTKPSFDHYAVLMQQQYSLSERQYYREQIQRLFSKDINNPNELLTKNFSIEYISINNQNKDKVILMVRMDYRQSKLFREPFIIEQ